MYRVSAENLHTEPPTGLHELAVRLMQMAKATLSQDILSLLFLIFSPYMLASEDALLWVSRHLIHSIQPVYPYLWLMSMDQHLQNRSLLFTQSHFLNCSCLMFQQNWENMTELGRSTEQTDVKFEAWRSGD